ncbi:MAG: hypothetical protein AAB364_00805 [Patescibacteria group bacterium]
MIDPSKILSSLPAGLRDPLIQSYQEIAKNYAEHRWEPAELNGGKFCECVYTIVNGCINATFPTRPSKPPNMRDACQALERTPSNSARVGDQSLRILIPRMLLPLYEIRNNRGVGHVGGDVDPNFLDATSVLAMASWVLAELVRIFHGVSTEEAQEAVDVLVERKHPLIWNVEDKKRVLDPAMDKGNQVLVLLRLEPSWVAENDLLVWVEYSTLAMFRTRILRPFHKSRLVEYDEALGRIRISPLGVKDVEERILKNRP